MEPLLVEAGPLRQRLERYVSMDQITQYGKRGLLVAFENKAAVN